MANIRFHLERRAACSTLSGLDRQRLLALASRRTGAPIDPAAAGLPLGIADGEELQIWRGEGDWSGVAWVTLGGDVVIFPGDEATPSNHTMQGGFELDDEVSAASRTHACQGADCWGCVIEQA